MVAAPVEEDRLEAEARVNEDVGCASRAAVDVITTSEGLPVPPVDAGLSVMTEVMRTTALDEGGAGADGGGTKVLEEATKEETGKAEDEGGGMKTELD
jgi:hypothetical protein